MRLMVLGASGIVGRATVAEAGRRDWEVVGLTRAELDVTDRAAVREAIARRRPELVVNAAAFTQVDRCESEVELAFAVNARALDGLAEECTELGARLVHLSSDYVFAGDAARPYREGDPTGPRSVYGASKLAGERSALSAPGALVVRTSWVFGVGGANFVDSVAGRLRRGEGPLRVVTDQVGGPTYAPFLAKALADLGESGASGVVHYQNREPVSWFELARAIAVAIGAGADPDGDPATRIEPATSAEIVRPARRPAWSVLDVARFEALAGRQVERWQDGLVRHLARET
jgi:dTDP-4-dehydrorhamnose reductase